MFKHIVTGSVALLAFSNFTHGAAAGNPESAASTFGIHQYGESFEGNTLPSGWVVPAESNKQWIIDNTVASHGSQSIKALDPDTGTISYVEWTGNFAAGTITFDFRTNDVVPTGTRTEVPPTIHVLIDGQLAASFTSYNRDWQTKSVDIANGGNHTIRFMVNSHAAIDTVWLDNVRFFETQSDKDQDGFAGPVGI